MPAAISEPVFTDNCAINQNSNAILFVKCPPMRCGHTMKNSFKSPLRVRLSLADETAEKTTNKGKRSAERPKRIVSPNDRVVGGSPCAPLEWPFVIGLYRDGRFHCGGVIHNELFVRTDKAYTRIWGWLTQVNFVSDNHGSSLRCKLS